MTDFPVPAYLSDAGRSVAEQKAALEAFLGATRQLLGAGGAVSTLVISSGVITPTTGEHVVDTQGSAVADDLTNIAATNLPDGSLLLLRALDSTKVVIVKHAAGGAGQIAIADTADFLLVDPTMWLLLRRSGALWEEVGRFYGNQRVAFRTRTGLSVLPVSRGTALFAPANVLTLTTDGDYFHVDGSVSAIGAISVTGMLPGTPITVVFDAACTISHSAALLLQGAHTRVVRAGDVMRFTYEGSGVWREVGGGGGIGAPDYTATQGVAFPTVFQLTHGLGAVPSLVTVNLRCIGAGEAGGWAVGDEMPVALAQYSGNGGIGWGYNATTIYVVAGSGFQPFLRVSQFAYALDPTFWQFAVRAWR
jgi:hypothetical protein